jgi:flagella basal body P-ring formation protein FlgA
MLRRTAFIQRTRRSLHAARAAAAWLLLALVLPAATAQDAGAPAAAAAPAALPAPAAPPAVAALPAALDSALEQQVRQLAAAAGSPGAAGAPRVEIVIGQLDPRLRLAPCQRIEPYLPEGMRAWGRTRVGLRCVQGSVKWNVYLPVTVKVFGTALVAVGGAPAGSVLAAADLAQAEVDLAEDASVAVVNADLAVGRTLARPIKAGQSLRLAHLKSRQWFAAGETVTVVAQGPGFSVASEAQALNNGIEGQPVRIRTESGRVLTGQPIGEHRVEVPL